jgi:hypothetical protein
MAPQREPWGSGETCLSQRLQSYFITQCSFNKAWEAQGQMLSLSSLLHMRDVILYSVGPGYGRGWDRKVPGLEPGGHFSWVWRGKSTEVGQHGFVQNHSCLLGDFWDQFLFLGHWDWDEIGMTRKIVGLGMEEQFACMFLKDSGPEEPSLHSSSLAWKKRQSDL